MSFLKNLFKKKNEDKPLVSQRKDQPDVFHVRDDEAQMNAAMEKARLTFDYFKSSLQSPQSHQQYFSLKAKIEDGELVEHIWLNNVSCDENDNFYGEVGNEPLSLRNVKLGQRVGVPFDSVSDWMIIENGRLIGGYTIRVLRENMSEQERASFDQSTGMYIDEGVDYFRHDFATPEGAILCLEDAYDAQDLDRAIACKDFYEEAKVMLAKIEGMKHLKDNEEMIKTTEEALRLSFIKHMQDGFPSFKGISRAFPKRDVINDNLVAVTEVCFYPNNTKSSQRLLVSRKDGHWKVLSLAD